MPVPLPISVVIPAFNAAAYLGEALASVAAQTTPPTEVIVVDDGSTDQTADLARASGVRVIAQPNAGVAAARNAGVRSAAMPWIAFLDADDRWRPERLAAQWRALAGRPTACIASSDYVVFGDGRAEARFLPRAPGYQVARSRTESDAAGESALFERSILARALTLGYFLQSSTLLVARRLFAEGGVWFSPRAELPRGADFHVGEDFEWMLRALRHSDVVVVERPLVEYRRSAGSLSERTAPMRMGDIVLGDYVGKTPERYAAGAAEEFARIRRPKLRAMAWGYLSLGDVERANAVLTRAIGERDWLALPLAFVVRPLAMPPGRKAFDATFRVWRRRIRPAVARWRRFR